MEIHFQPAFAFLLVLDIQFKSTVACSSHK